MQKQLLVIGYVWPEPQSSAAGWRMLQLLALFLDHGYQVCFASPAQKTEYSSNLEALGIQEKKIAINDSSVDVFLEMLSPSVVLFDRFMMEEQLGWRIREQCPHALTILDTEDLHFLRKAREKAFKQSNASRDLNLYTDETKRELAAILRCDLSLIISEVEMQLLQRKFGIKESTLFYLPFLFSNPLEEAQDLPGFNEREGFMSIGNFLHAPNWDQVLYLKEEIWPLIREQLPEATIEIYGAYTSEKVNQLHQPKTGFIVQGRAKNLKEVMSRKRVLLAPLRFGAGLKGKLVDAMRFGLPSVTTSVGAEAIGGKYPWSGEIANNATTIALKAVHYYNRQKPWEKAQKNGFQILAKRFNRSEFEGNLIFTINHLLENLELVRNQNFLGQILNHQHLKSTKYMSLWIEEKNKNKT